MNRKTKKIIVGLVLALQFVLVIPAVPALAACLPAGRVSRADESIPMEARKLLVTAYYSPLPDQTFYIRGSYEADIKLNGRGTNGADGTQVFVGMLAAPKTYPFGTRVKIPGLGVGEVHDRGGAILAGKDYDRIDVWMGSGEEGLSRALNWGARVVQGEVYLTPDQIEPGLSFGGVNSTLPDAFVQRLKNSSVPSAPSAETSEAVSEPEAQPVIQPVTEAENKELERLEQNRTLLAAGIGKDDNGDEVKNLQRMLWDLGFYQGEITGQYDQVTVDAVFSFQVENGVLQSEWDKGAGYFGKKTLEALVSAIERKIQVLANYPKEVQVWVPAQQVLPEIAALAVPEVVAERQALVFSEDLVNKKPACRQAGCVQVLRLSSELDLDDQSDEVAKLQNFLIERGYLAAGLNTGFYGPQTEAAVLKFQLEQGVIDGSSAQGAGRVGPQTLAAINSF